jgi:hypothetical protein
VARRYEKGSVAMKAGCLGFQLADVYAFLAKEQEKLDDAKASTPQPVAAALQEGSFAYGKTLDG